MSRQLLETYTRLLTVDTRACAALFARDAEFSSRMGEHELSFTGRHEIEGFLTHVPRQIAFRTTSCERDGEGYSGEILVQPDGLPARLHSVRFDVVDGRFQRFHVWPSGASATMEALLGDRALKGTRNGTTEGTSADANAAAIRSADANAAASRSATRDHIAPANARCTSPGDTSSSRHGRSANA